MSLCPNAIVEHRINDLRLISDAVRRAVHHSRSSRKRVVVSVPQTHVITRTINLPAGLAEREIEEQVMIEAAQRSRILWMRSIWTLRYPAGRGMEAMTKSP